MRKRTDHSPGDPLGIGARQRTESPTGRYSAASGICNMRSGNDTDSVEQTSWSPSSRPHWVSRYLTAVHRMVEEADFSSEARVRALRVLELQNKTIQELELENWADAVFFEGRTRSCIMSVLEFESYLTSFDRCVGVTV